MFTTSQIQSLLSIVDYHSSFVVATILGRGVLNDFDADVLRKYGIDVTEFPEYQSSYYSMYLWGKLSAILSSGQALQLNYEDFEKYVKRGQYVPLDKEEKRRYDIARVRSYSHLKGYSGKQKERITSIISDKISEGFEKRKTLKGIISEIGHASDMWNKDWGRIVDTEYNNIFQQGRAEAIKEKSGKDAIVFKDVYDGACKHCIKAYLTAGIGSEPKIFKLSELQANGTNIGKKVADWQPVVSSMHPHCRCTLRELPPNYEWDAENKVFKPKRKESNRTVKVKMKIGDKEFLV